MPKAQTSQLPKSNQWAFATYDFININNIIFQCGIPNTIDGSEDDKILRDIEIDTNVAESDENPNDDVDELDFFSDEDNYLGCWIDRPAIYMTILLSLAWCTHAMLMCFVTMPIN